MYLIPSPHKITEYENEFTIKYNTKIILDTSLGMKEFHYARILQKQIEDTLGYCLAISKSGQKDNGSIFLQIANSLKPEEYQLLISPEGIKLMGGNSNALLYAVQTLRQIILQKGAVLPGLLIEDYPEIQNRGFYYDVTRGRIPTLTTLKELADKMSYYKLNQLQLYIEHSFLISDFSEVWRDDTPLTPEEILEFDRYCSDLNIELIPSIASLGHLHKVLSTKTYEELCELPGSNQALFSYTGRMEHHTVDVTNEKSFAMLQKMLLEYLPLFRSKQFNICGDEPFDMGKGRSKPIADEVGTDKLYIDFLNRLCKLISSNGKQPMFWGDIIIQKPELIKELPKDAIYLNWDYCINASEDNTKTFYEMGVTQYLCPGIYGWRRLINHYHNAYDNVKVMSCYAHRYQAAGLLNTDWGDYGHICNPEFSTTGMIYGAAFSWNSDIPEFEQINRQVSAIEYGDPSESFVQILHKMTSLDGFLWNHAVQYKELCQKTDSMDQRKEYFNDISMESLQESNVCLAEGIGELYRIISVLDTAKRYVVKPYLVAAAGMQLMNALGATLAHYVHGITNSSSMNPHELAVRLEYWFLDYKEIWRTTSKESELYRLQEVFTWYEDYLRELSL